MTDITINEMEQILLNMTAVIMATIQGEKTSQTEVTLKFNNGNATAVFDDQETRLEHTVRQRKLERKVRNMIEESKKPSGEAGLEPDKGMKEIIKGK